MDTVWGFASQCWCSFLANRAGSQLAQTSLETRGSSVIKGCIYMIVCLLLSPLATKHMLSLKHAHDPECSHSHVNITFFKSAWRYKHRSALKRWLFFSLSPWLIFPFTLRACQSVNLPPPLHIPHLVIECRWCWHVTSGTSSLHVLHRHFSAHFPFPKRPDCEAPVMMWKRRLRSLHHSSGLMNAFWTHSSPWCYRISFSKRCNRWIKWDQNGSNLLVF